jgi:hypothetical protein
MAVETLINIMPPPETPIEPRGATWTSVESAIGTVLPSDYKAFIEKYGSVWAAARMGCNPGG